MPYVWPGYRKHEENFSVMNIIVVARQSEYASTPKDKDPATVINICSICRRYFAQVCVRSIAINGGAEIASTGKCKYGKVKYKVAKCVGMENTSTEKSSMKT